MKIFSDLFLGVGAMKAGTTWVAQHLRTHPDIYFAFEKEISYFAYLHAEKCEFILSDDYRIRKVKNYISNNNTKDIELFYNLTTWCQNYLRVPIDDWWYKNNFVLQGRKRYSADFSNLNAHINNDGWNHVKSLTENLKVLFIMRDPIERAWSHVRFQLQIDNQLDKLEQWCKDDYYRYAKQYHIWRNSQYSNIVNTLLENLDSKQLKIIFFDSIKSSPINVLNDVEKFLEIEQRKYNLEELQNKINPSKDIKMPEFFIEILYDESFYEIKELKKLGINIPDKWLR